MKRTEKLLEIVSKYDFKSTFKRYSRFPEVSFNDMADFVAKLITLEIVYCADFEKRKDMYNDIQDIWYEMRWEND